MLDWLKQNEALLFWLAVLSVGSLVLAALLLPVIVVRLPADYFVRERLLGHGPRRALDWCWHIGKNLSGALFVLAGIAMLVLPGMSAPARTEGRRDAAMKIEPALAEALRANTDAARSIGVIITFRDTAADSGVRRQVLQRLGIVPTAVYEAIPSAAATVTPAQIEALAAAAEVLAIESVPQARILPRP